MGCIVGFKLSRLLKKSLSAEVLTSGTMGRMSRLLAFSFFCGCGFLNSYTKNNLCDKLLDKCTY